MVIELMLKKISEAKLEMNEVTSLTAIVSSASGRTKMVVNVGDVDTEQNRLLTKIRNISLAKIFA
jgi:hypothetical protein